MKVPSHRPTPPTRWVNEAPGTGVDAELGNVFRALSSEQPLENAALAAVGRRLAQPSRGSARRPFRYLPLALAVLVVGSGAALAEFARPTWQAMQVYVSHRQTGDLRLPAHVAKARPAPLAVESASSATTSTTPSDAPAPTTLEAAPTSAPAAESHPGTGHVSHPGPSALGLETELLQKAFTKLRRDHDARGALVLLDDYQARFPHGSMSLEAATARVDALLLSSRRDEAFQLLLRLPLQQLGRRTELTLVRGELMAERDCSKALADFDVVLAASPGGGLGERALYGRAGCRLRLGQVAAGHTDLQQYLARFPEGRFAERVRARLAQHD